MSLSFDEPVDLTPAAADPAPASEPTTPDAPANPTPTPAAAPVASAAPAERTYSQAEFDRHMAGLRKAERERYERELERSRQTPPRQEPVDDDPLQAAIAPLRQEVETFKLERAKDQVQRDIERLSERFKDFDADAVVQHALDIGTTNLEAAYKSWNHDRLAAIDVEKIRAEAAKKAIADYVAGKEKAATEAPSPEGNGGTATIAPAKDFSKSSWDEVDAAATATIRRSKAATS